LVEEALAAATDLNPLERLLDAVNHPYDLRAGLEFSAEAQVDFGDYQTLCGT
jgi:protein adenylyltransferase